MPKWPLCLLIGGSLFASTGAQSIAQFELQPASSSSHTIKTESSPTTAHRAASATAKQFPQVGDATLPAVTGVLWLTAIGGIWIKQGGRHAH